MKPIYGLLVSLLLVAAGVCWLLVTPEPATVTGVAHPEFSGMRVGGETSPETGNMFDAASFIVIFTIAAMVNLMLLAIRSGERRKSALPFFMLATAANMLIWVIIRIKFGEELLTGSPSFVLGFPVSSAWAVYGVWSAGLVFSAFYVFGFKQCVFSDKDQQKFDSLVAKYRPEETDGEQS